MSLRADPPSEIPSDSQVDAAIAQLTSKDTRISGLEKLIPFAGYGEYRTGHPERDGIIRKAAAAVMDCRNVETIGMALCATNPVVQRWALHYFPWYPDDDYPAVATERWRNLLPLVRQLAQGSGSTDRGRAQQILFHYEGQREFLTGLVETETSPENVMRLLNYFDVSTYRVRMDPHMLRILNHKDEEIRRHALRFIGFDAQRAPMWQFRFSDRVLSRVMELSRAESGRERASATYALIYWRDTDVPDVRARLFQLARDSSDDVRRLVPLALRTHLERADVRAVLGELLKDEAPIVRYFAILVLGPQKYIQELTRLTESADRIAAELAADQLKALASQKDQTR